MTRASPGEAEEHEPQTLRGVAVPIRIDSVPVAHITAAVDPVVAMIDVRNEGASERADIRLDARRRRALSALVGEMESDADASRWTFAAAPITRVHSPEQRRGTGT